MQTQIPERYLNPVGLRHLAAENLNDNHCPGDPGYCRPQDADWTLEALSPSALTNVFASPSEARAWLDEEIAGLPERDWDLLLVQEIREEATVLIRDGRAYVWDGYHRAAASIAVGKDLRVIVGRPRAT